MQDLNKQILTKVKNIKESRLKLEQAQKRMSEDIFNVDHINEVQNQTEQLMQTSQLEEQILLQKYKLNWMKFGNGNTTYFLATIRGKTNQIRLYKMEDPNGKMFNEAIEIEGEVIRFYRELVATPASSIKHMGIIVLREGAQIDDRYGNDLI